MFTLLLVACLAFGHTMAADGPCTKRLMEIQTSKQNGVPLFGVEEPKCDANGDYASVQCMGSVCYCVDNMGMEVQGYTANIGQLANMNCQCARDLAAYKMTGMVGKLFDCDANGNYKQTSSQGGNTTPQPIVVAATQAPTVAVVGGGGVTVVDPKKVCAKALGEFQTNTLLGAMEPHCDADGMYAPTQCQGSECYCVRKDGTKIDGYSAPIAIHYQVTCQCARDKDHFAQQGILGKIHTCRHTGNYQQYQCLGSVCYCTDDVGARVEEHSANIGDINSLKCP